MVYIIAEIGSNHDNNLDQALNLITIAKNNGANAVKFQLFKSYEFTRLPIKDQKNIKKFELNPNWLKRIINFSKKINIDIIFSVFGEESLRMILPFKLKSIKIASSEIDNHLLLSKIAKKFDTIILSTGMANETDIFLAKDILRGFNCKKIILMHCISDYPTKLNSLNLNYFHSIKNFGFDGYGFSDHTMTNISSSLSVTLGATYIEKHITINNKLVGPDHFYALEPNQFKKYCSEIRKTISILGKNKKIITNLEKAYGRKLGIYSKKNLKKNQILKYNDLLVKAPALGIRDHFIKSVIGNKLKRSIKKDNPIKFEDLC